MELSSIYMSKLSRPAQKRKSRTPNLMSCLLSSHQWLWWFWWSSIFPLLELLSCLRSVLWVEPPPWPFFEMPEDLDSVRAVFPVKQWRTRIWWVLTSVEQLPWITKLKITSLSRLSSDHQLWGIPSAGSSNSSWCTEISSNLPGLIMPAAGVIWSKTICMICTPQVEMDQIINLTNNKTDRQTVPRAILGGHMNLSSEDLKVPEHPPSQWSDLGIWTWIPPCPWSFCLWSSECECLGSWDECCLCSQ